jgi:hypothetical protein
MLLRQRYSALLGGYPMTKITSLHAIARALSESSAKSGFSAGVTVEAIFPL